MVYSDTDYNLWYIDQCRIMINKAKAQVIDITSNELDELNKMTDKLTLMYEKRKTDQHLSETRNT